MAIYKCMNIYMRNRIILVVASFFIGVNSPANSFVEIGPSTQDELYVSSTQNAIITNNEASLTYNQAGSDFIDIKTLPNTKKITTNLFINNKTQDGSLLNLNIDLSSKRDAVSSSSDAQDASSALIVAPFIGSVSANLSGYNGKNGKNISEICADRILAGEFSNGSSDPIRDAYLAKRGAGSTLSKGCGADEIKMISGISTPTCTSGVYMSDKDGQDFPVFKFNQAISKKKCFRAEQTIYKRYCSYKETKNLTGSGTYTFPVDVDKYDLLIAGHSARNWATAAGGCGFHTTWDNTYPTLAYKYSSLSDTKSKVYSLGSATSTVQTKNAQGSCFSLFGGDTWNEKEFNYDGTASIFGDFQSSAIDHTNTVTIQATLGGAPSTASEATISLTLNHATEVDISSQCTSPYIQGGLELRPHTLSQSTVFQELNSTCESGYVDLGPSTDWSQNPSVDFMSATGYQEKSCIFNSNCGSGTSSSYMSSTQRGKEIQATSAERGSFGGSLNIIAYHADVSQVSVNVANGSNGINGVIDIAESQQTKYCADIKDSTGILRKNPIINIERVLYFPFNMKPAPYLESRTYPLRSTQDYSKTFINASEPFRDYVKRIVCPTCP